MKQITIYDLLQLLKKGWVAMDKDGSWIFFTAKPRLLEDFFMWARRTNSSYMYRLSKYAFNIAPFDGDWKDRLIKVEHKEEE